MMLERCPLPDTNAVAEIGFGTGELLREVVARARPALAVGIAPERWMLAHAAGFEARLGDEDLPLGDAAFHLVYSSQGLHPAELRRVLQPGGWGAIWTPVTCRLLDRWFPSLATSRERPERQMRLLADAGFPWVAAQQHVARESTTLAAFARAARGRRIAALASIPEAEFAAGAQRLEEDARRDPGRRISHSVVWCLIWARM
jgi:hypothetical protein